MTKPTVVFMGAGAIGLPTLHWLADTHLVQLAAVVTQPDRPSGRSQIVTAPAPKTFATSIGVPVLQPEKIRRGEAVQALQALQPDLIIVMAYGQILPKSVLELPRLACLNLHASLLPRHRGASPIQAAVQAGDVASGVTVMYMAEGLDTGDILLARALRLRRRETGGSLHDRLANLAPEALGEALPFVLERRAPRQPQDETLATYAPKLDSASGRIDWRKSCWELDRTVRALHPWPGAFTLIAGKDGSEQRLKLHRVMPMHRVRGAPGAILGPTSRGLVVACGEGALLLLEVQLEGKKRVGGGEFTRGFRPGPGTRLESGPGTA